MKHTTAGAIMRYRMSIIRTVLSVAGLAAWGALLYGVLDLQNRQGLFASQHSLCGPWGCGATTEALASWHGFWALLMLPPVVYYSLREDPRYLKAIGAAVAVFGVLGIVCIFGWSTYDWLTRATPRLQQYVVQRALFVLIADTEYPFVDLPIVQVAFSGALCWLIARFRKPVEQVTYCAREPTKSKPRDESTERSEAITSRSH